MSKCISQHGEYSDHTFTHNAECDYCGEPLPHPAKSMIDGLREIQELHPPVDIEGFFNTPDGGSDSRIVWVCGTCEEPEGTGYQEYPCATRQLADKALGETS